MSPAIKIMFFGRTYFRVFYYLITFNIMFLFCLYNGHFILTSLVLYPTYNLVNWIYTLYYSNRNLIKYLWYILEVVVPLDVTFSIFVQLVITFALLFILFFRFYRFVKQWLILHRPTFRRYKLSIIDFFYRC